MAEITEIIKQKIDLVAFIERYVKLKKTGRNVTGLCPFHKEKSPSFFVSPERQTWHCFGCNKGGDVFAFLMEKESLDFKSALTQLAQDTNTQLTNNFHHEEGVDLYDLCEKTADYFHQTLLSNKNSLAYQYVTQKRKINESMITKFKIGYSPDSWEQTGLYLHSQGFTERQMMDAGLVIPKEKKDNHRNWYDRFRNRLMFPITNRMGKVVGFSARSLDPNETGAKYINSPETPIFKKSDLLYGYAFAKESIHKLDYAIVVEGQLDVISVNQVGIENVVAPQGSAFTETQANIIAKLTNRLVLLFDGDDAGIKATLRTLEIALKKGFEVKIANLTNAKDPDEAAHKNPTQLKIDLKNTFDFLTYLFNKFNQNLDPSDPHKSAKITRFILPFIAVLPNLVQQETLINDLAIRLNVSIQSLFNELKKSPIPDQLPQSIISHKNNQKTSREDSLWYELIAMLLQLPEALERDAQVVDLIKPLFNFIPKTDISEPVTVVLTMIQNDGKIDHQKLNLALSETHQSLLDSLTLKDLGVITADEEQFLNNLEIISKDLEIGYIKQRIKLLARQSTETNLNEIKQYTKRLNDLTD